MKKHLATILLALTIAGCDGKPEPVVDKIYNQEPVSISYTHYAGYVLAKDSAKFNRVIIHPDGLYQEEFFTGDSMQTETSKIVDQSLVDTLQYCLQRVDLNALKKFYRGKQLTNGNTRVIVDAGEAALTFMKPKDTLEVRLGFPGAGSPQLIYIQELINTIVTSKKVYLGKEN